jgi:hypothetical protein
MPQHLSAKKRVGVLIASAVVLSLSGLVLGARAWRAPARSTRTMPEIVKATSASVVPQRRRADIQAELITIVPHGFEPLKLTRPRGRFLLMIDNRSGLETVTLRLTLEGGPRVREMRVPREQPDWSEVVDLEVGRYVLSEANHSDWVCVITITR